MIAILPALIVLSTPTAVALTLDEAMAAAESHSPALGLVRENTEQALALRQQAYALISPKVVGQATYTINDKEIVLDFTEMIPEDYKDLLGIEADPITLQRKTVWEGYATVVQPLFNASSLPALRGTYSNVRAAEATERQARQQIRAGTAKVYYGLAVARAMEQLATRAIESAKSHLALADQQVAVGLAPERARLQAQLALARAERDLAQAHEGVVTAQQAFTDLTGLPADTDVALPEAPPPMPGSLDEALAQADAPELDTAEANWRSAQYQTNATRASWLPTLDARYTYVWTQNTGFSGENHLWMLVFQADWTLWDGGARLAQTRSYASQARQAELLMQQSVTENQTAVRTAWERFERGQAALQAAEREQALAEENLRLAETAFASGGLTWLEAEDARLGLHAAQSAVLQERAQRDLAAIDLAVAMGRW